MSCQQEAFLLSQKNIFIACVILCEFVVSTGRLSIDSLTSYDFLLTLGDGAGYEMQGKIKRVTAE